MISFKTRPDDNSFAERLSNGFHFLLAAFFALITSDLALRIAAKLIG